MFRTKFRDIVALVKFQKFIEIQKLPKKSYYLQFSIANVLNKF